MLNYKKKINRYNTLLKLIEIKLQSAEIDYSNCLARLKKIQDTLVSLNTMYTTQKNDLLPVNSNHNNITVTGYKLRERLNFIQNIDNIIKLQLQAKIEIEQELEIKKEYWLRLRSKAKQMEKLIDKYIGLQKQELSKQQQYENDAVAANFSPK